jgi:hypothetical protein
VSLLLSTSLSCLLKKPNKLSRICKKFSVVRKRQSPNRFLEENIDKLDAANKKNNVKFFGVPDRNTNPLAIILDLLNEHSIVFTATLRLCAISLCVPPSLYLPLLFTLSIWAVRPC